MRSGFERKVKAYLDSVGVSFTYEADRIPYKVPETKRAYIPDFRLPNGIYVESKGRWLDKSKMLLVIEQNPHLDIRMLFMRDLPIRKGSKTLYSTFCEKKGIKYAVSPKGVIPEEWLL